MLIQYLLLFVFILAILHTWRRVRGGVLRRTTAIVWSLFWIAAAAVVLRPETTTALAHLLGVGRGVDVIVYLAVVTAFYLIFRLFSKIETLERQLTQMIRLLALRDFERPPHERKD